MDGAVTSFFSMTTVIFAIVVWFLTVAFRSIVESIALRVAYIFPDKYEPYWVDVWKEWVLPAAPIVIGGLVAFLVPTYPYPAVFAASESARIFFGLVAGGASGYSYRFFKHKLNQLLPQKVKELEDKVSEHTGKEFPEGQALTPADINAMAEAEKAEKE